MKLTEAIAAITQFVLKGMRPTGVGGFEGLAALLIQEATGQEFRISSSGRQHGRDAASEIGYGSVIKIETKHYRSTTRLKPRELITEIGEAVTTDPNLDLWVLVTSRSISDQIETALYLEGESRGIDVVLLDVGANGLPRLIVLMARFAKIVEAWASRHTLKYDAKQLRRGFKRVAAEPDFTSTGDRLQQKLNGYVGYEAARRKVQENILKSVNADANAKGIFHQSLAIRAPGTTVVPRSSLNQEMDQWWRGDCATVPAVVLGEEGTGKTWGVFDWAVRCLESGEMPILLPFSAVTLAFGPEGSIENILPHLIAKWIGTSDESKWQRRLQRWWNLPAQPRPVIVLVIDGLNERADVLWRPILASISNEALAGKVALVATDRPHHWRTRGARSGLVAWREIKIGGYSPAELSSVLASRNLRPDDIPDALLPLISIPRYCGIALDHYQELVESEDFTRDRLIFLDIHSRQTDKFGYPISGETLTDIIRELAARARQNPEIHPQALLQLLCGVSRDVTSVYEEITGGGFWYRSRGSVVLSVFG